MAGAHDIVAQGFRAGLTHEYPTRVAHAIQLGPGILDQQAHVLRCVLVSELERLIHIGGDHRAAAILKGSHRDVAARNTLQLAFDLEKLLPPVMC